MSQPISLLDADQVTRAAYDDTTGSFEKGCWSQAHTPAAAAQATTTKAAVAGTRHICNGISATIACAATPQTPITIYLRDGASGVGAVLFAATVAAPVNQGASSYLTDVNVVGTINTAMTLEFSAAGVAGSLQAVTLSGWEST